MDRFSLQHKGGEGVGKQGDINGLMRLTKSIE